MAFSTVTLSFNIYTKIKDKLFDSIKTRLRSDFPIAFFLSGGIDSNALAFIAKKYFNYDVKTHLESLETPALVLCTDDPQGQKSWRTEGLLKNAKFVDIPFPGQGVMDLHTELITGHMQVFLDRKKQ